MGLRIFQDLWTANDRKTKTEWHWLVISDGEWVVVCRYIRTNEQIRGADIDRANYANTHNFVTEKAKNAIEEYIRRIYNVNVSMDYIWKIIIDDFNSFA